MATLSPQLKQATPVLASRGEGVYLFDDDGRRYLDFTAGIGVTSTGHCHPAVVAAIQEQAATLATIGPATANLHRGRAAERIHSKAGDGFAKVFFS